MKPNAEQAAILADTISPRRLIIAGAGSGKTATLVAQIKADIQAGHNPAKMVAITFTNAGADELAARLPGVRLGFVGTLHAWCLHLLNRHGAAIGYQMGRVAMIDEETERRLIQSALASIKAKPSVSVDSVREWKASGSISNPAAIAAKKYMANLRARSCVDFDSVLFEALRLIAGGHTPDISALYVDEYQDSGTWDAEIYAAAPALRLFIVGDPDQSIYRYRGGCVENILALAASPEWTTYRLEQNHRSAPQIIEAANRIIANNSRRLEKTMRPADSGLSGWLGVWNFTTPLAEAAGIAGKIKAYEWGNVAVLTRYNAQIPAIVSALEAEGFKVQTARKDERHWLPVAISALNAIFDPDNDLAAQTWLSHFHRMEPALFNFRELHQIEADAAAHGRSATRYALELADLDTMNQARAVSFLRLPPEAFHAIVAAWKLDAPVSEIIAALMEGHAPKIENEAGTIYVGTVHSFKGREADNVVLAGMVDAATPAKKTGEELEEERRLFYVGVTRARFNLAASFSSLYAPPFSREMIEAKPSRFIAEAFPQ